MNSVPEDEALKDRIFYIHVDGYKEVEKINILKDYLLPKQLKNLNLEENSVRISENVCRYIVNKVAPNDKGIRNLERSLKDIINKTSFLVSNQKKIPCSFSLPDKYFPFNYPVNVTNEMVDVFLKNFGATPSTNHLSMYT
jgi:ATP-dependent Lon protease